MMLLVFSSCYRQLENLLGLGLFVFMTFSCHGLALMYKAAIILMKASVGSIDRRTVQWLFFNSLSNALIAVGCALRAHWSAHSVWRRTISSPFPSPPHPLFFFFSSPPFCCENGVRKFLSIWVFVNGTSVTLVTRGKCDADVAVLTVHLSHN